MAIATVLKPIVVPIFCFLVVAPIAWVLYRLFPKGRLKVILFRDRNGPHATRRDKWIIGIAAIVMQLAFFAWIALLAESGGIR